MRDNLEALAVAVMFAVFWLAVILATFGVWAIGALWMMGVFP